MTRPRESASVGTIPPRRMCAIPGEWAYETARQHEPHSREGFRCGWCAAKLIADAYQQLASPERKRTP